MPSSVTIRTTGLFLMTAHLMSVILKTSTPSIPESICRTWRHCTNTNRVIPIERSRRTPRIRLRILAVEIRKQPGEQDWGGESNRSTDRRTIGLVLRRQPHLATKMIRKQDHGNLLNA